MQTEFTKLASYNYRRAAYHAAQGNADRVQECLATARQYDKFASESN